VVIIVYYQLLSKVNSTTLMLITIMMPLLATLRATWFNQEALDSHLILELFLLCAGLSLSFYFIRKIISIK
jgi:predicted Na+-dependent transporter